MASTHSTWHSICYKAIGESYVITNYGRWKQVEAPTQIFERDNQPWRPVQNLDKDSTIEITAHSDSDWAGPLTQRKSTSGVVIKLMNTRTPLYAHTHEHNKPLHTVAQRLNYTHWLVLQQRYYIFVAFCLNQNWQAESFTSRCTLTHQVVNHLQWGQDQVSALDMSSCDTSGFRSSSRMDFYM